MRDAIDSAAMNLVLLEPDELSGVHGRVRLSGRRCEHLQRIRKVAPGDRLAVGVIGGGIGTGFVLGVDAATVELEVTISELPPPRLPLTLLLALPRPKVLRRVLQAITTMGVKRVILVASWRVEKSYWASPYLRPEALRHQLVLGLEQSGDTVLPAIEMRRRFKPFVEDELGVVAADTLKLVAHPQARQPCPRTPAEPVTLAIGPEGGFTDYEIDLLVQQGFNPVTLGPRLLRVEQAVPALLARLS